MKQEPILKHQQRQKTIDTMTESEYTFSGNHGFHCEFIFKGDLKFTGVIAQFFFTEPHVFYLVTTNNMVEFKKFMDAKDEINMKKLCIQVDLADIISVNRLWW